MKRISSILLFAICCVILQVSSTSFVSAENLHQAVTHTELRSRFVTNFETSGNSRRVNIGLAAASFHAIKILPNQTFSFNHCTGERNADKGYQEALVIDSGIYVKGIGGGVCQVSTTLYNAALLAGLEVVEVHAHTIRPSYVPPSFDAMVAYGLYDLKIKNITDQDILLHATIKQNDLIVEIFGAPMQSKIKRSSEIIGYIPPQADEIVPDTLGKYQDKVVYVGERYCVRKPISGVRSRGYLIQTDGSGASEKLLIRQDYYAPLQGMQVEGTLQPQ